ncbi:hypothetical protein PPACK8108_LOCUS24424, partial [Phakopsora pachyrhizi]
DDEDDSKHQQHHNNDRARLADRNSSNTGWMAAPDWLVIDHNLTGSSHSLLNRPTNTLREKPLRMTNLTDWDSTLPQKLWVQPSDLHLIPKQIRFSTLHVLVTPRANLSHKSRLTECPDGIDLGSKAKINLEQICSGPSNPVSVPASIRALPSCFSNIFPITFYLTLQSPTNKGSDRQTFKDLSRICQSLVAMHQPYQLDSSV